MIKTFKFRAAAIITLLCPSFVYGVTIGQVDNFEDGTTQNWIINVLGMGSPPFPPVNVPTGGPAGVADNYLRLTSTGIPDTAGGRLVAVQYQHQWTGNYIAAGITAITMDVNNLGTSDLYLRLLIADPMDAPPANEAFSIAPIFLPAGSGWRAVTFPVGPGFFTADAGTVTAALSNATELRVFNSAPVITGSPAPPFVAAVLGVDNITAIGTAAIPEPATNVLFGLGIASIVAGVNWRKR